jgi:hypothetical protein
MLSSDPRLALVLLLAATASPAWAQALVCRGSSVAFPEALVNLAAEPVSLIIDMPHNRVLWDDGTAVPILHVDETWITWRGTDSYAYYDGALNRVTGKLTASMAPTGTKTLMTWDLTCKQTTPIGE